jgi:peptide/nickel transport system permease protein
MTGKTGAYILKRLLYLAPVLVLTSILMFSLIYLSPGDPVNIMLGMEQASPEAVEMIRKQLGLDRPPHIQYLRWLWGMVRGDFGTSVTYLAGKSISSIIGQRLPVTATLAVFSLFIALLIGFPVGVISATQRGKNVDYASTTFAILGISMPGFWLGFMLMILFSIKLKWLPTIGFVSFFENPWESFKHIIMPALAIGAPLGAVVTRMLRSCILENIRKDYVEMGRAYGLPSKMLFFRYVLRNSLIPTVTVIGLNVRYLIAGTVVIEKVFALPGLGALLADAVFARDFVVVQGTVMVLISGVVLSNLLVDIIYVYLDPRIEY